MVSWNLRILYKLKNLAGNLWGISGLGESGKGWRNTHRITRIVSTISSGRLVRCGHSFPTCRESRSLRTRKASLFFLSDWPPARRTFRLWLPGTACSQSISIPGWTPARSFPPWTFADLFPTLINVDTSRHTKQNDVRNRLDCVRLLRLCF